MGILVPWRKLLGYRLLDPFLYVIVSVAKKKLKHDRAKRSGKAANKRADSRDETLFELRALQEQIESRVFYLYALKVLCHREFCLHSIAVFLGMIIALSLSGIGWHATFG